MSPLRSYKYDLYISRLDGLWGFQPSFAVGAFANHHYWLRVILTTTYYSFLLAIVAVFAAYLALRPEWEAIAVAKTFALNLLLALPIYLLFPVCGPAYAFPKFPDTFQQVVPHPLAILGAPNGMPSVHFSNALLVAWFARHWFWGRCFGIVFVILTAAATLGLGEHYLFDLIVAIPYAFLISQIFIHQKAAAIAPLPPEQVAASDALDIPVLP
jgi:hypothetical protein